MKKCKYCGKKLNGNFEFCNSKCENCYEKMVFFKKKWLHEHISTIVLCVVAWIGIIIWTALKLRGSDSYALLGAIGSMLAILFYVVLYNRMMVYVENHAYRATPDKETKTKN